LAYQIGQQYADQGQASQANSGQLLKYLFQQQPKPGGAS
jgi:hypothetical protein